MISNSHIFLCQNLSNNADQWLIIHACDYGLEIKKNYLVIICLVFVMLNELFYETLFEGAF